MNKLINDKDKHIAIKVTTIYIIIGYLVNPIVYNDAHF